MVKDDYLKLQFAFPSLRLPQDQEVDACKEIPSTIIPKDYNLFKSLDLSYLRALSLDRPINRSHHLKLCKDFDRFFDIWKSLLVICKGVAEKKPGYSMEVALELSARIFTDHSRDVVDRIIEGKEGDSVTAVISMDVGLGEDRVDVEFC